MPSNWVFPVVSKNVSGEPPTPLPALPCKHPPWLYRKGDREQFAPRLVNNWPNNSAEHRRWSDSRMLAFHQSPLSYQIKGNFFFKLAPTWLSKGDLNCCDFPFFPSNPQEGERNSSYPVLGVCIIKPELGCPSERQRKLFWNLPGNKCRRTVCDSL